MARSNDPLSRHDLGHVDPKALHDEIGHAERMLKTAVSALSRREYSHAMNEFFRSGAVAVNVLFTAKTHRIPMERKDLDRAKKVVELSTDGIRKIVKATAFRKVIKHEKRMHKSK